MKKNHWIVIGIALLALLLLIFTKKDNELKENTLITIGADLSLTGDFSIFGQSINQGALLAIDDLQKEGYLVKYIPEDNQSKTTGTVNAAQKLLASDTVNAVITSTIQEVKPLASIFAAGTTPLIAVWDSNDFIKSVNPNVFTIGFSTENAGEQLAAYAVSTLGKKKFAVISQKDEWSQIIAPAFSKKVKELGAEIVYEESIQTSVKDFRSIISIIKSKGADAVFIPFIPGTISPFIIQADQLKLGAQLLTGDSFSADEMKQTGNLSEGIVFANLHSENMDALSQKYEARFGEAPADPLFLTFGYDGIMTAFHASNLAQEKGVSVSEALRRTTLHGVDTKIDFSGTQYAEKLEKLYTVRNGQIEEIK